MRLKQPFLLLVLAFLGVAVLFFACQKEVSTESRQTTIPPPSDSIQASLPSPPEDPMVQASVQGIVLDENNQPVKDAMVNCGGMITKTDMYGVFETDSVQLHSRFGYVRVTREGYFTGSRTFITRSGHMNFVHINLIPRLQSGSFSAGDGGTVSLSSGLTISFGANAVADAVTNAPYSGTVKVFAHYLDPADNSIFNCMPGDLRGISKINSEVGLQSLGMLVVELENGAGGKLQIAPGKTVVLDVPIPSKSLPAATDSIPLWYFNDTTGKWIEQGMAVRQGNHYHGVVSHFSYWNCDYSLLNTIHFSFQLRDQFGNPVPYASVQFLSDLYGIGSGATNSSGDAQGWIPSNDNFLLQVVNKCGSVIYSQPVITNTTDLDFGIISIVIGPTLELKGMVNNCGNQPVKTGSVNVYLDGLNYTGSITDGHFILNIDRCQSSTAPAAITTIDDAASQQGPPITVNVNSGQTDLGNFIACGESTDQYINIKVNNNEFNITVPPGSSHDSIINTVNTTALLYWNSAKDAFPLVHISFELSNLNDTGTYSVNYLDLKSDDVTYSSEQQGDIEALITHYGDINGFIEGTLTGTEWNSSHTESYPLTGSFRIKREH